MKTIWIIAKREYNRYFATPAAYAIAFMLFLILGFLFYYSSVAGALLTGQPPQPQSVTGILITLLLFATPAVTMHLIAEEQRMGTIELLMTAPVKDWHLVVGKWLGGFLFVMTLVAITLVYPAIMDQMVEPGIDVGPLISSYIGVAFVTASFVAIGVAISTFFKNQIASFFLTLGVLLLLWVISAPSQASPAGGELLTYLSFNTHIYTNFFSGVIDLRDVVYFVSMTALALFIGSVNIETKRWR